MKKIVAIRIVDFCVVGAGVVGLSAGYAASKLGSVIVVEQGAEGHRNGGSVGETRLFRNQGDALDRFRVNSAAIIEKEIDPLQKSDGQGATIDRSMPVYVVKDNIRSVDPEGGVLRLRLLMNRLKVLVRRNGGEVRFHTRFDAYRRANELFVIDTSQGSIYARHLIQTMGPWAVPLAMQAAQQVGKPSPYFAQRADLYFFQATQNEKPIRLPSILGRHVLRETEFKNMTREKSLDSVPEGYWEQLRSKKGALCGFYSMQEGTLYKMGCWFRHWEQRVDITQPVVDRAMDPLRMHIGVQFLKRQFPGVEFKFDHHDSGITTRLEFGLGESIPEGGGAVHLPDGIVRMYCDSGGFAKMAVGLGQHFVNVALGIETLDPALDAGRYFRSPLVSKL